MSQHVQAVFERRLRPIYDNLEVGNNRKALQETEKLLKKHPNLLCARALKGLALLKLGRHEESHGFLISVTKEQPVDESTLQVLSFCYKEMEQLDRIVDLYNNAVKLSPGNEELLANLFISHVRLEDFKSQQSVALKLYKIHPKNAYYFWAVMSVVLQGTRGSEKDVNKRRIYLSLAQRMVDKLLEDNKLESEQEVLLYLQILKLQGELKQAFSFTNSTVWKNICSGAPSYVKIDLMKNLGLWNELYSEMKELLEKDCDRWDYYQDLINSCFEHLKLQYNGVDEKNNAFPNLLEDCSNFINHKINTTGQKFRGPYLARLELYRRVRKNNLKEDFLDKGLMELIFEYFDLFGTKPCCTHDIALFLNEFSVVERRDLASTIMQGFADKTKTLPAYINELQKHICGLQISRICSFYTDFEIEKLSAFYALLKVDYLRGLNLYGKNLLQTEFGPSDAYVLLAANVMYDISYKEKKSDRLFEVLCLLQYALRNSTSNFHVMLMSAKIFHMFGCILGAQEMYDYLDIKQIQLDSMGFIHCNLLPLCGRFSTARSIYDSTLKFFTNSYKERLEYIVLAYRFCTFSKLEEFMDFKEKLSNSIHYISISIEAQLSDLVTLYGSLQQNLAIYSAMNIEAEKDRIVWDKLCDNRDLSAIIRWDPLEFTDAEAERNESFRQEVEILHLRSMLLRLVAALIDVLHPPSLSPSKKDSKPSNAYVNTVNTDNIVESVESKEFNTVELLLDSWQTTYKRLRSKCYQVLDNRFLASLLPTRLHLLLDLPYEQFFNDLGQLILQFCIGDNNLHHQCKIVIENVNKIEKLCIETINESEIAADSLWGRREWQAKVVAALEILSLYAFILSVCYDKMQMPVKSKPKKKPNQTNVNSCKEKPFISEKERTQLVLELMKHLKSKLLSCELKISKWKSPTLMWDFNYFMADMSFKDTEKPNLISDIMSTFKESHELMITELKNLVKDKVKMISK